MIQCHSLEVCKVTVIQNNNLQKNTKKTNFVIKYHIIYFQGQNVNLALNTICNGILMNW